MFGLHNEIKSEIDKLMLLKINYWSHNSQQVKLQLLLSFWVIVYNWAIAFLIKLSIVGNFNI